MCFLLLETWIGSWAFCSHFWFISEELSCESEGSEKFEGDEDLFLAVGDLD